MKNAKSEDFLEVNCKVTAPHTASYLLKFKSEFDNSKLEAVDKDPDEWISHLDGLQIWMNEFGQKGSASDKVFMIHILNNLSEEYDVILNKVENHLTATGDYALTIDSNCKKLNHRYKKLRVKKRKNWKRKNIWCNNQKYKQRCQKYGKYRHKPGNWRCPENKNEKEENNKRTENKKIYISMESATIAVRKGIEL